MERLISILMTDSKMLDPCRIQSHSPLTICLIAVGGNRSARMNPTLDCPLRAKREYSNRLF